MVFKVLFNHKATPAFVPKVRCGWNQLMQKEKRKTKLSKVAQLLQESNLEMKTKQKNTHAKKQK